MVNTNFIPRTYTPKKINYWKRDKHEDLLRKLQYEITKTPTTAPLSYLTDYELLIAINGCLSMLGLQIMTEDELSRPLSLRN